MDIKSRQERCWNVSRLPCPSKEEITQARAKKKEQKKERAQRAIQRERDRSTESYLGATSVNYIHQPGVPPAAHLHPGTLAFLEKFRPSVFNTMNLGDKQISLKKETGTSPSEMPPSVSTQAKEEKDS